MDKSFVKWRKKTIKKLRVAAFSGENTFSPNRIFAVNHFLLVRVFVIYFRTDTRAVYSIYCLQNLLLRISQREK